MQAVVHAHFYQPPRENPWTGRVDEQPDAEPFHDWNERILSECYRPNAFARVPTSDGEVSVNNYERLSFNVGPTLLAWLEEADRDTYQRMVDADRTSIQRLGHGNAIAQAFHHTILPLAQPRDARTEVRWGVADFRHRFGRDPEGMWLPETAANDATLELLIEEGLRFTILAPHQATRWRMRGGEWRGLSADDPLETTVPYRFVHRDGSGRFLTIFFYDAQIAQAIAFDKALTSAERFLDLFEARASRAGGLVHAATDGETYGHHHTFGDLGLAYALFREGPRRGIEFVNYGSYLERFPATREVQVVPGEGTSWSCTHGVGRWATDCGCWTRGEDGWSQAWRAPLRQALELVKAAADDAFEQRGRGIFSDPWRARDRYVDVVLGRTEPDELVRTEAQDQAVDVGGALQLLELQRNALALFTSCGWFFSDCSGIETIQVLRYARRALDLLDELGAPSPEEAFLAKLSEAKSNVPELGTAAEIFTNSAR